MRSVQPEEIVQRRAVNKTASLVTNQSGCSDRFTNDYSDIHKIIEQIDAWTRDRANERGLSLKQFKKSVRQGDIPPSDPVVARFYQLKKLRDRCNKIRKEQIKKHIAEDFTDIEIGDVFYILKTGNVRERTRVVEKKFFPNQGKRGEEPTKFKFKSESGLWFSSKTGGLIGIPGDGLCATRIESIEQNRRRTNEPT